MLSNQSSSFPFGRAVLLLLFWKQQKLSILHWGVLLHHSSASHFGRADLLLPVCWKRRKEKAAVSFSSLTTTGVAFQG
jgi:hypothetical protein